MDEKIITLSKKIKNLQKKIGEIRAQCPHEKVNLKYDSNTGNYDPSADRHWISGHCLDCGEYLSATAEENPKLYREYGQKIREAR